MINLLIDWLNCLFIDYSHDWHLRKENAIVLHWEEPTAQHLHTHTQTDRHWGIASHTLLLTRRHRPQFWVLKTRNQPWPRISQVRRWLDCPVPKALQSSHESSSSRVLKRQKEHSWWKGRFSLMGWFLVQSLCVRNVQEICSTLVCFFPLGMCFLEGKTRERFISMGYTCVTFI